MGYTHGTIWTEDLIKTQIIDVVETLGLNRFPTHKEIINFYGNMALANKISKSGGTKYWAEKLNYKVKNCDSEFGEYFEKYSIQDIYNHTGLNSYKNRVGYPYDITTNKHIKVDVKSSSIVINKNGCRYNSFNLEKSEPTCDIYLLYCLNDAKNIHKTLIIPSCVVYGQTQIGVSTYGWSKWGKYRDNWKIFDTYDEFYKKLSV